MAKTKRTAPPRWEYGVEPGRDGYFGVAYRDGEAVDTTKDCRTHAAAASAAKALVRRLQTKPRDYWPSNA